MIGRKSILICLFFSASNSFAQTNFYYPNGTEIILPKHRGFSTNDILDSIGAGRLLHTTIIGSKEKGYNSVNFKVLSNIPVLVELGDKGARNKLAVQKAIDNFDYRSYLNHYTFFYDVKSMIDDRTLTKPYLLDIFGKPDIKDVIDTLDETWTYEKHNLAVTFVGDNAVSFKDQEFSAIKANRFSYSFDAIDDTNSTDFAITVTNYDKRPIKYIYFTAVSKNRVKDVVSRKVVRGIGPVRQGKSREFNFPSLTFTNSVFYISIDQIKIQYMDSSIRIIPKAESGKIIIRDWAEIGNRPVE